jgi:hypothetical protein
MSISEKFTPEEWAKVVAAPMVAGIAVTAADPGGIWGALKESASVAGALRAVKAEGGGNALIEAVTKAYESAEGRDMARGALKSATQGRKPEEIVATAVAELKAAGALVEAKAPEAAAAYRAWLRGIAAKVAEAGTEGGFLGFGGVRVSEAEAATLGEIDRALA